MKITGVIVLLIVVVVAIIDVGLVIFLGSNATISWWLWTKSHEWPAIPFSFGVLMGHFFFSQPHIPPQNELRITKSTN